MRNHGGSGANGMLSSDDLRLSPNGDLLPQGWTPFQKQ
jgi:hypothetical protein